MPYSVSPRLARPERRAEADHVLGDLDAEQLGRDQVPDLVQGDRDAAIPKTTASTPSRYISRSPARPCHDGDRLPTSSSRARARAQASAASTLGAGRAPPPPARERARRPGARRCRRCRGTDPAGEEGARRTPRSPRCTRPGTSRPAAPTRRASRDGGERLVVERLEVQVCGRSSRSGGRGAGHPVGPAPGRARSAAACPAASLRDRRAVDELDHRVDDRLRVHHDVDAVEGHVEQQVRLDDLEALVDQGRRVGRDQRAHVPGRVRQRLLGRHVASSVAAPAAERPSAGGEHQPLDLAAAPAAQALGQRRVLGVDGHDLPRRRGPRHERAPDDQRLLVRQREDAAGAQGRQRRRQTDRRRSCR